MKTFDKIFLFIIFSFFPTIIFAQSKIQEFPNDESFPKEVESYMGTKTSMNKDLKSEVKLFTDNLEKNVISGDVRTKVNELMNLYLKKRANPSPHMLNLIKTFNAFQASGKNDLFNTWYTYIKSQLSLQNMAISRINDFTQFTYNLLTYNSLFYGTGKSWYLVQPNYRFEISNDNFFVNCNSTDIRCRLRNDSSLVIYSTQGKYSPSTKTFYGHGGKTDWRRGGLSPDSLYAELNNYSIDMNRLEFSADSVVFYNKKYFSNSLLGKYSDKVVTGATEATARYPQFTSYNDHLIIPNLAEGIDYEGSYTQNGVIFMGGATDDNDGKREKSQLHIKKDGKPFIEASGEMFVFGLKRLEGKDVRIKVMLEGGYSITHKGLRLRYDSQTEDLTLFRGTEGMENCKFIDDYHRLDINVHQLQWHRNDSLMYLSTGYAAPLEYATFVSSDYFSESEYRKMQGMDRIHPLILLRDYIKFGPNNKTNGMHLHVESSSLTEFLNKQEQTTMSEVQVHQMLIRLAYDGFVDYDIKKKQGEITQKVFDYTQSKKQTNANKNVFGEETHRALKDYDNIAIISRLKEKRGNNATLNLKTNELYIFEPEPFNVSVERMVKFLPDSVLTVNQSRNMVFNGKIQAGLADIHGENFKFNYNLFKVDIVKGDSMAMLALNKKDNKERLDSVRSVFENIKGTLYIDTISEEFNNKSGLEEFNQFPRIVTSDTSYVYYDNITGGKYDRNKFYMEVFPFKLDSLNFIKLNGVKAKGTFVSGIFPDLDVTLDVQPDFSLGFEMPTPEHGMSLFKGKGTYHNTVKLNGDGLGGDGEINYLTTTAKAKQFMFYPDSVTGGVYYFDVRPVTKSEIGHVKDVRTDYPDVHADTAQIFWNPGADIFSSRTNNDTAIVMYNGTIKFNGQIDITPTKMGGDGELLYKNSGLFSKKFSLGNTAYQADSALFCLFDEKHPGDSTGFLHTGYFDAKFNIDPNAMYAQFVVSNDSDFIHFPQHKYKQRADFFRWNINADIFEFGKDLPEYDSKMIFNNDSLFEQMKYTNTGSQYKPIRSGVTLTCTKDTLTYDAYGSSFNVGDQIIEVNEPGEITIVDSKIDPTGIIKVHPGGRIGKFDNALITCNKDSLVHKVLNTSVMIRDKYYYKARGGEYEYRDLNDNISYMKVDSIEIRKQPRDTAAKSKKIPTTLGVGNVPLGQNFMLSPTYKFAGGFSFRGFDPGIKFNGFAYLMQECDSTIMPFKFEGNLNPDSIVIPVSDKVVDTAYNRLYTGFFYDDVKNEVYSLFMGHKRANRDFPILEGGKNLSYASRNNQYQLASEARLSDPAVSENFISLYKNICYMYGEGSITSLAEIEPLQLVTKGTIFHQKDINKININMLMSLNFFIRNDVMKIMAEKINDNASLKPVVLSKENIRRRLLFLMGRDTVSRLMDDYSLSGEISKVPGELAKSIVIPDLQMRFDTTSHTYRSYDDIGLGFVNGIPVNRYVPGYVEIVRNKRRGDEITIYLQPSDNVWFYFNYKAGFLYCLSSDQDFNNKIINTKDKERVQKYGKNGQYEFVIGNEATKNKFIKAIKSTVEEAVNLDQIDLINKSDSTITNDSLPANNVKPIDQNNAPNNSDVNNNQNNTQPVDNQQQKPAEEESDFEEEETPQNNKQNNQNNTPQPQGNNDDEEEDYIDD